MLMAGLRRSIASNPYDAWFISATTSTNTALVAMAPPRNPRASRGFLLNREIISLEDYRQRYAQSHTEPGLQVSVLPRG